MVGEDPALDGTEATPSPPPAKSSSSGSERTTLGPGTPDVPTAGSTATLLHHVSEPDLDLSPPYPDGEMLRSQKHAVITDGQRPTYNSAFRPSPEPLDHSDPKHHSPGCDDSGVFLEEPISSSPETQAKSAVSRLHNITLQKFHEPPPPMRQYSAPLEGLDSDAEKSDDLGLASSSIDSADDLDGDPLPSTLQICPPAIPTRQKPPPVPLRKSLPRSGETQRYAKLTLSEIASLAVPNHRKPPLSKSSSSGEDSIFGEGDIYGDQDQHSVCSFDENSRNVLNDQRTIQSRNNTLPMTRSYNDEFMAPRESNHHQESKASFLARTLSSSSSPKTVDLATSPTATRAVDGSSSGFKWKSEECLRTAAESKWSLPGRRYEKSVSVKDRIAMFSEMEASQAVGKQDLHRYGSETNIKAVAAISLENRKADLAAIESKKQSNLSRDLKWQSLHNISKKYPEKETPPNSALKPALSIPSLSSNSPLDSHVASSYSSFPIKLEVEPPKPIVSTYPETQLTNNKRYNYGLYSLKNLKNTEDLLSKKASGSNLLSIIDSRKQPVNKLKGLVIPEKPLQTDGNKALPVILSSDSESAKDSRRASLPITVVTTCKTMSLPRNKKSENPLVQKQISLSDPPWKSERATNISNTLPKYSPAFKKRSLELPGSSLSPTPPSSLTSPLSPPPSSPSSICSSNASSTLQQNVFQFSLSHSKPVQPLQPEKALMSPPSLPSDVEYEGDNSEDSSHSASPMRHASRAQKEAKVLIPSPQSQGGLLHYDKSNSFTSNAKPIALQPLLVENLTKGAPAIPQPPPRAAVCISKTEISLRREVPKPNMSDNSFMVTEAKKLTESSEVIFSSSQDFTPSKKREGISKDNNDSAPPVSHRNGSVEHPDLHRFSNGQNGTQHPGRVGALSSADCEGVGDASAGKFRACPLNLNDARHNSGIGDKLKDRRAVLHSEYEESEDDDSHSTLSHRTEDSRHTTTDECLSDATTDSFEKPRVNPEVSPSSKYLVEAVDYASTEGYLSDASTDVSLRRFTQRPVDGSTEEYLSDATAESPDPEWIALRSASTHLESQYGVPKSDIGGPAGDGRDLRPKLLSLQRTVLRASAESSSSVQKFKALAEKWEQRTDVTSPPPPSAAPLLPPAAKRETKPTTSSTAPALFNPASGPTAAVAKGKGSSLPPSLMPRNNAPSFSTEKKAPSFSRPVPSPGSRLPPDQAPQETLESNGWTQSYYESSRRRDSTGSSSGSSKTTLKEEEEECASPTAIPHKETVLREAEPSALSNGYRTTSSKSESWNNEPRNRRGADFTKADTWVSRNSFAAKTSVSDIRRSFESKEVEKPPLPKKPPVTGTTSTPSPPPPACSPPRRSAPPVQEDDVQRLIGDAQEQLLSEGAADRFVVLPVLLRREGVDGGSVGITLAGGADYEVKEITVHKVISGSIADRDGRVQKGDRVLSINGRDVRGVSHGEALHILKAPNPKVILILARSQDRRQLPPSQDSMDVKSSFNEHRDAESFFVELQKDATGVGFSIEGGKDSPQGDRPLLVKRVFKGGAADKEGRLEEGDEILSVNGHPVTNMTRTEAWNFLKKLPEGLVRLQIRKTPEPVPS